MNNQPNQPADSEYCKRCDLRFANYEAFHLHKLSSNNHIACGVCGQDFHTAQGLKRHYDLSHSADQNLNCLGCKQNFNRVGSLINHLEFRKCPVIPSHAFKLVLESKRKLQHKVDDINSAAVYRIMFKDENDEPTSDQIEEPPAIRDDWSDAGSPDPSDNLTAAGRLDKPVLNGDGGLAANRDSDDEEDLLVFGTPDRSDNWTAGGGLDKPVLNGNHGFLANRDGDDEEDLLIFGSPVERDGWEEAEYPIEATLNSTTKTNLNNPAGPWGHQQPTQNTSNGYQQHLSDQEYPSLPTRFGDRKLMGDEKGLDDIKNLVHHKSLNHQHAANSNFAFNKQVPASQPLPKSNNSEPPLLSPLSTAATSQLMPEHSYPDPEYSTHDPDAPGFNVRNYWNEFLQKYQCPHAACTKSVATAGGFKQHLKSAMHLDTSLRLRCHNCLRYFASATALTQHSESQSVRCQVRETSDYAAAVDRFTAGIAAPKGRHDDNTIRYVVNNDPRHGAEFFAQANKDEIARREVASKTYWVNRRPNW
ncbi:C2H2 finger domain-containing protein [Phlyctema vagabunda]|uniref:C2H2 finger domain-containing protein n=1 Tax=Phlyctema vagabunda TaxID=108571 RepID=A0ABR4PU75_9HELO